MIFPVPKKLNQTGSFSFNDKITVSVSDDECLYSDAVKTVFGNTVSDGNLVISYEEDRSLFSYSSEAYGICFTAEENSLFVKIRAAGKTGFMRGLFALKRMCLKNEFITGDITDYPDFSVRGYIEGFYGAPWKSEERLEMLELMALFGENTHYYAPKDDPYHRSKWRELYPENKAEGLKKLVEKAHSLMISFYYCIAPGLSMKYSDENDFLCLCEKTKQLFSMGVRNFGLLLDDIPTDLFYEEDKKLYGTAARAHGELVRKYFSFLKSLSEDAGLTVCPTAYHGKGNEKELTEFTCAVPEEVQIFYTGSDICSKEITKAEAENFCKYNKHKPLYWDNYPVNDAEMFMEMHIGPVIGREKGLHTACRGIISNCMEYFNCNKIPLITIASYLWNCDDYDAEKAYDEALNFLFKGEEKEDFVLLADHFRTSCLHDENSRIMGENLSSVSVLMQTGNIGEAEKLIEKYTFTINAAAERLNQRTAPIYKELSRWIKKFCLMSDILSLALSVIREEAAKQELHEKMTEYNESATVLTSFCFREYIESVLNNEDQG